MRFRAQAFDYHTEATSLLHDARGDVPTIWLHDTPNEEERQKSEQAEADESDGEDSDNEIQEDAQELLSPVTPQTDSSESIEGEKVDESFSVMRNGPASTSFEVNDDEAEESHKPVPSLRQSPSCAATEQSDTDGCEKSPAITNDSPWASTCRDKGHSAKPSRNWESPVEEAPIGPYSALQLLQFASNRPDFLEENARIEKSECGTPYSFPEWSTSSETEQRVLGVSLPISTKDIDVSYNEPDEAGRWTSRLQSRDPACTTQKPMPAEEPIQDSPDKKTNAAIQKVPMCLTQNGGTTDDETQSEGAPLSKASVNDDQAGYLNSGVTTIGTENQNSTISSNRNSQHSKSKLSIIYACPFLLRLVSAIRVAANRRRIANKACRDQFRITVRHHANPLAPLRPNVDQIMLMKIREAIVAPLDQPPRRIQNLEPPPLALSPPVAQSPAKKYVFNLLDLLQGNAGTYTNISLGTRHSRAQLRKRELGAIIPYQHSQNEPIQPTWQVALMAALCIYQHQQGSQESSSRTSLKRAPQKAQLPAACVSPKRSRTSSSKCGSTSRSRPATDFGRKRLERCNSPPTQPSSHPSKVRRLSGQPCPTSLDGDQAVQGHTDSKRNERESATRKEVPIVQTPERLVRSQQLTTAAPQVESRRHRKRKARSEDYPASRGETGGQARRIRGNGYSKEPGPGPGPIAHGDAEESQSKRKQEINQKERSLLERFGLLVQKEEKRPGVETEASHMGLRTEKSTNDKKSPHQRSQKHVHTAPPLRCGTPSSLDCHIKRKTEQVSEPERDKVFQPYALLREVTNRRDDELEGVQTYRGAKDRTNALTASKDSVVRKGPPPGVSSDYDGINQSEPIVSKGGVEDTAPTTSIPVRARDTSDNERRKQKMPAFQSSCDQRKTKGCNVEQYDETRKGKGDRSPHGISKVFGTKSADSTETPMRPRNLSSQYPPLSSSREGFQDCTNQLKGRDEATMFPISEQGDPRGSKLPHGDQGINEVASQGSAAPQGHSLTLTSMQKEMSKMGIILHTKENSEAVPVEKLMRGCLDDNQGRTDPDSNKLGNRSTTLMKGAGDRKDTPHDGHNSGDRRKSIKEAKRQRKRDRKERKRKKKEKRKQRSESDVNTPPPNDRENVSRPLETTFEPKSYSVRPSSSESLRHGAVNLSSRDASLVGLSGALNVSRTLEPSGSRREETLASTAIPSQQGVDLERPLETMATEDGDNLPAIQLLCSEAFLETWAEPIAELASGGWAASMSSASDHSENHAPPLAPLGSNIRARKIQFLDTSLIDRCGVDIEVGGRDGVIVTALSNWKEPGCAKLFLRRIVELASQARYKHVEVILCTDVGAEDHSCDDISNLQNALMMHRGNPPTRVSFRLVSPASLSLSVAQIVLASTQNKGNVEPYIADDRIRERLLFLLELVPTLTVGTALQWFRSSTVAQHAPEEAEVRQWFQRLLGKSDHVRKQVISSSRSEPSGNQESPLLQLSYAVGVSLGSK